MLQTLMNSKSDFVKTSLQWSIRAAIYLRHKARALARTPEDPETQSEVIGQSCLTDTLSLLEHRGELVHKYERSRPQAYCSLHFPVLCSLLLGYFFLFFFFFKKKRLLTLIPFQTLTCYLVKNVQELSISNKNKKSLKCLLKPCSSFL